jgi:hypothetical protein
MKAKEELNWGSGGLTHDERETKMELELTRGKPDFVRSGPADTTSETTTYGRGKATLWCWGRLTRTTLYQHIELYVFLSAKTPAKKS